MLITKVILQHKVASVKNIKNLTISKLSSFTLISFQQMSPLAAASTPASNRQPGSTNSTHSTPLQSPLLHSSLSCGWSASCLRPPPPLRPCLALSATVNGPLPCSGRKPMSYKEDAMILDVIEAYCSAVKPRNTVNSGR